MCMVRALFISHSFPDGDCQIYGLGSHDIAKYIRQMVNRVIGFLR